ncbi:site-specific integrase [Streptomyces sp. NBC_00727]|uniref:tyrosine-type recombinase/integrase n=1 Tax=Streptomyces sp. NBC_00727 TaxID=2903675 RepID=UPI003868F8D2
MRIDCQRLNSRFIDHREVLGLDDGIDFHSFRMSYATHLVENGWDPRFVQGQVGHEHASTTRSTPACPQTSAPEPCGDTWTPPSPPLSRPSPAGKHET